MSAEAKWVNEFLEEMCDICYSHTYGVFVEINGHSICKDCSVEIQKAIKIFDLKNE
ncbi:hypothetical protein MOD96_01890 [Bacillus sp. S17B2]|uniref:hypothetical protein n=1 Tax=Bacillus sp. S17B2 TaxID=2918907 RepID=UPI00227FF926|nr:hypothetical protein [Bacillus sp. S17B2]